MGFEPTTFCLGSKHSATELRPPEDLMINPLRLPCQRSRASATGSFDSRKVPCPAGEGYALTPGPSPAGRGENRKVLGRGIRVFSFSKKTIARILKPRGARWGIHPPNPLSSGGRPHPRPLSRGERGGSNGPESIGRVFIVQENHCPDFKTTGGTLGDSSPKPPEFRGAPSPPAPLPRGEGRIERFWAGASGSFHSPRKLLPGF